MTRPAILKCSWCVLLCAVLTLAACGDDTTPDVSAQDDPTNNDANNDDVNNANNDDDGNNDDDVNNDDVPPSDDWCERITPGAPSDASPMLGLSNAHSGVRFFGANNGYAAVDDVLAQVMERDTALTEPNLGTYAQSLTDVCALDARVQGLSRTRVEVVDGVAFVRPGADAADIPEDATAVVLDFRNLPNDPNLGAALVRAAQAALWVEVQRPTHIVRQHNGLIDEYFSVLQGSSNIYTMAIAEVSQASLTPGATNQRPLAVWTEAIMPPAAVEMAATLRLTGHASLIGQSLLMEVAESSWAAVGDRGIAWRSRQLRLSGRLMPDVVQADHGPVTDDTEMALLLSTLPQPSPINPVTWTSSRTELTTFDPNAETRAALITPGTTRAALITAHGAARRFFPFFGVVGAQLDPRLEETLNSTLEGINGRAEAHQLLRRLSNALEDAHSFVADMAPDQSSRFTDIVGFAPLAVDPIGDKVMVRRSATEDILPGDEILAIDGQNVWDMIEAERAFVSAASEANGNLQAATPLAYLLGPTEFEVRSPDGQERQVLIEPVAFEQYSAIASQASRRPSGMLDDLGAPDVFYFNLDGETLNDPRDVSALIDEALQASALILDMRGYPGLFGPLYRLAGLVVGHSYSSPLFTTPIWSGAESVNFVQNNDTYQGPGNNDTAFDIPVVLLVGPGTQSAAENFSMGLVTEEAVTVMGRPSSGTNGNITGLRLPGQFALTFTGLGVEFSDGQRFHGVGIQPQVDILPDAQALRDSQDPELDAALDFLTP